MNERDLISLYKSVEEIINARIEEFRNFLSDHSDEELFMEMAFCLLTPQSKARVSWNAILALRDSGLLFSGSEDEIMPYLKGVRFYRTKAGRIVRLREMVRSGFDVRSFLESDRSEQELRDELIRIVDGYGMKEASHFLRNVGKGLSLSILDRHILKNLKALGVIDEIPKSLTRRKYLEIEEKMRDFSKSVGIDIAALDLVLWYKETGEVFK